MAEEFDEELTGEELAQKVKEIHSKLSDEGRAILEMKERADQKALLKGATAAIMTRNFSHGKGDKVKPKK